MVQYTNHRASAGRGRIKRSLTSTAENALTTTAKLFSKDFTANEYKLWSGLLAEHSDAAVEWAFENWSHSGKFFPKPAEILELIHAFALSADNQVKLCGKCKDGWVVTNPEAKPSDYAMRRCECFEQAVASAKVPVRASDPSRYGKGYGTNDVLWLWKQRQTAAKPWNAANWNSAMDRLDKVRAGGAPEWRQ
jgi:hypothetical protein